MFMNADPAAVTNGTPSAQPSSTNVKRPRSNDVEPTQSYWLERKRYLAHLKRVPELRSKFARELSIYLLRRLLWSFTFFPVFLAFWVPLILAQFNPVLMVQNMLPSLQAFVQADPEAQATTMEGLLIAWFSIGIIFAVFDLVLTPFKSPYEQEADIHMRAWEQQIFNRSLSRFPSKSDEQHGA